MKYVTHKPIRFLISFILLISFTSFSQDLPLQPETPAAVRAYDSLLFSRIPVVSPQTVQLKETLPPVIDNTIYPWFSGFYNQMPYWTCLQVSSCTYMFAYEINRLRDTSGRLPENTYPFLYTWTWFNHGINTGVSSFHSFHTIRNQGHMNRIDMGPDSLTTYSGWASGYDKYYRAMKNRIRKVKGIRIDTEEGIILVKNYLANHLDGSSTGGLVHFASSSGSIKVLPSGTPEAGNRVYISLGKTPSHGYTTVGYHDSIRFDLNNDGQYTNNLDINGDGIVNVKDWEIGGFKQIESYYSTYLDTVIFYVLYSTIAQEFSKGGPWNNTVYIIDAEPSYHPLLTMKVKMEYNLRNRIKVMAGVSRDPDATFPGHLIEFPVFNFQGGELPMRGTFKPGDELIEFGLDVTPLLSYVESSQPVRFYLVVEERDTNNAGYGIIHNVSFYHYGSATDEFISPQTFISVENNGSTFLSATGTVEVDRPVIEPETLPPFQPGEALALQMQASGGVPPYSWTLREQYQKSAGTSVYQPITGQSLSFVSTNIPYAVVELPFSFPYFGTLYDTVYVNKYGMIQFTSQTLPYPWVSDELDMLLNIAAISPAFSYSYTQQISDDDGIWMRSTPDSVVFRWKMSLLGSDTATNVEFLATLFPDGRIVTCTGPVQTGLTNPIIYSGLAKGDGINAEITPHFDFRRESGKSIRYYPLVIPEEINLTEEGLLTLTETNPSKIFDIRVQVTDAQDISAWKTFGLSAGLEIGHELSSPSRFFQAQEEARLDLVLKNTGSQPIMDLEVKLTSSQPGISITDSILQVDQLQPGVPIELPDCFRFNLTGPLPDGSACPFTLLATSDDQNWKKDFYLDVAAPDIVVHNQFIEDGVNQLLDVGETAYLVFSLSNQGSLQATDLTLNLVCNDPYLEVVSANPVTEEELAPDGSMTLKFLLHVLPSTPPDHQADLTLHITNDNLSVEIPVSLRIGICPVALITLSGSSGSAQVMAPLLDNLQIGYTQYTYLPPNLHLYPHTFLFLGTNNGSYVPSAAELSTIREYLLQGGTMYMENFKGWYAGIQAVALKELFKYWHLTVPLYYYETLTGSAGSNTGDMQFHYLGEQNYATFEVVPLPEGTSFFKNTDTYPKCIVFAYDGEVYKTIGTMTEFAGLADTNFPSTKAELLHRYFNFFGINPSGPYPFFHADHTLICRTGTIQFTDDSYPDVISWQWEFPGGSPATSTEQHPLVIYNAPGLYDAILTVSDGTRSCSMHKHQYIRVTICAAVEPSDESPRITIYPNPARDELRIRFTVNPAGLLQVNLFDLNGRTVRTWNAGTVSGNQEIRLPTEGISPGMYLLQVIDAQMTSTRKVLIE